MVRRLMERIEKVELPGSPQMHWIVFALCFFLFLTSILIGAIFSFIGAHEASVAADRAAVSSQTNKQLLQQLNTLVTDVANAQNAGSAATAATAETIREIETTLNDLCAVEQCGAPPITANIIPPKTIRIPPPPTTATTTPKHESTATESSTTTTAPKGPGVSPPTLPTLP